MELKSTAARVPTGVDIKLFYHPKDRLRMTVFDERSYVTVKPAWASPISHPGRFLALLDGKDTEIATIDDLSDLDPTSRAAVDEELRRRYLTSNVVRIENAKVEFGATYWHVTTDRGERDFVTQSLQENAVWMSERHLLLVDVDGNRFEIQDIEALDARSQSILSRIV
jgi:hypothetical protein